MKVLKNSCFGGFSLSDEAYKWLIENNKIPFLDVDIGKMFIDEVKDTVKKQFGKEVVCIYKSTDKLTIKLKMGVYNFVIRSASDVEIRTHKGVIECFKALGSEKFSGGCTKIVLVEIPDDVEWEIHEDDGIETIREKHRTL